MPPRPASNGRGATRACSGSAGGPTRSCARSSPGRWGCEATMAVTFTDRAEGRFAEIARAGLFTAEHQELRSAVRDWVRRELAPHAAGWEAAGGFPVREVF